MLKTTSLPFLIAYIPPQLHFWLAAQSRSCYWRIEQYLQSRRPGERRNDCAEQVLQIIAERVGIVLIEPYGKPRKDEAVDLCDYLEDLNGESFTWTPINASIEEELEDQRLCSR